MWRETLAFHPTCIGTASRWCAGTGAARRYRTLKIGSCSTGTRRAWRRWRLEAAARPPRHSFAGHPHLPHRHSLHRPSKQNPRPTILTLILESQPRTTIHLRGLRHFLHAGQPRMRGLQRGCHVILHKRTYLQRKLVISSMLLTWAIPRIFFLFFTMLDSHAQNNASIL